MSIVDFDIERVRASFDTPEAYPGECLEGVIQAIAYKINVIAAGDDRRELRALCLRLIERIDQREAMS